MANAINDDEIIDTDHDTGNIDETKRNFPRLKIYNAMDGSISLKYVCDVFSCNKIEDISQWTYDVIFILKLKKRDQRSKILEINPKSLHQRWFTKGNSISKQGKMTVG